MYDTRAFKSKVEALYNNYPLSVKHYLKDESLPPKSKLKIHLAR